MINQEKYENAILYFMQNIPNLDQEKLECLLYYLDFISYRDTGKTVTGDTYVKMPCLTERE